MAFWSSSDRVDIEVACEAADGQRAARLAGRERRERCGLELKGLIRLAVGVDRVALAGAAPVEAELLDVLQAKVVNQCSDSHLGPRAVDPFEHLAGHLDVRRVIDHQQPVFLGHGGDAAERAEHREQRLLSGAGGDEVRAEVRHLELAAHAAGGRRGELGRGGFEPLDERGDRFDAVGVVDHEQAAG